MIETITYRTAQETDWHAIEALLQACDLPLTGAREALAGFVVARHGKELIGCAALETHGRSGLLRSLAVAPDWRGHGVASALTTWLLDHAGAEGLDDVTLLTTTAADYFTRFRFQVIPRGDAPEAARASVEFREACPDTATVMTLALV
jgi:amino-acid N-acetyltransferase